MWRSFSETPELARRDALHRPGSEQDGGRIDRFSEKIGYARRKSATRGENRLRKRPPGSGEPGGLGYHLHERLEEPPVKVDRYST